MSTGCRSRSIRKYEMRNFIDIVTESLLMETVFFHPSIMKHDENGIEFDFPSRTLTTVPCQGCEYLKSYDMDTSNCEDCGGSGTEQKESFEGFPSLNVGGHMAKMVAELLGSDSDEDSGFIEERDLPGTMRRLIAIKNSDMSGFEKEPSDMQRTRMDRSGDIPTIRKGPRMIGGGWSSREVEGVVDKLIEIVRWAQQNHMVVSWA